MEARALVVESYLSSRRQIVRDLSELRLADEIIEAESVNDALSRLSNERLDACVFGPRLQPSTALGLVAEAKNFPIQRNCAFLALTPENTTLNESSLAQLLDATISYPYTKNSFSDGVRGAIIRVQQNTALIREIAEKHSAVRTVDLCPDLLALASDLHRISRKITSGSLSPDASGAPSPALAQEIRRILERLPLNRTVAGKLSGNDEYFVRSVAAWFSDRTRTSHSVATAALRERLSQ